MFLDSFKFLFKLAKLIKLAKLAKLTKLSKLSKLSKLFKLSKLYKLSQRLKVSKSLESLFYDWRSALLKLRAKSSQNRIFPRSGSQSSKSESFSQKTSPLIRYEFLFQNAFTAHNAITKG